MAIKANLSVKSKMFFLLCLTVLPLAFFSYNILSKEYALQKSMEKSGTEIEEVQLVTNLVHNLQEEWQKNYSKIMHNHEHATSELELQKQATNQAFKLLDAHYKKNNKENNLQFDFTSLMKNRGELDRLTSEDQIESYSGFYSEMIKSFIDGIDEISKHTKEVEIKNQVKTIFNLTSMKEQYSLLRVVANDMFSKNKIENYDYGRLKANRLLYDYHFGRFKEYLDQEHQQLFNEYYSNDSIVLFIGLTNNILEKNSFGNFAQDYFGWKKYFNTGINALYTFENKYIEAVQRDILKKISKANARFNTYLFAVLAIVLLALVLAFTFTRDIINGIYRLKNASKKIAKGEVEVDLDIKSNDELGQLSRAFKELIDSSKKLSEVSNKIGNGDYSVHVPVRSEADLLGKSLEKMRKNLQGLSADNDRRTWILSGKAEINSILRHEKETKVLCVEVLQAVARYLKVEAAVIYMLNDENELEPISGYCLGEKLFYENKLRKNGGLAGQSAREKKPLLVKELPEEYLLVETSFGKIKPANILAFPLLYNGDITGVLEFGSVHEFSDLQFEFVERVSENISIALTASKSREKQIALLEETQTQAEELMAQQEDLEAANRQLESHAQKLQASEEELRAQQDDLLKSHELLEENNKKLIGLSVELQKKTEDLILSNKYKSEFLANMSHELRTPLNSILLLSKLLVNNKDGNLNPDQVEYANVINSSGNGLLELIDEILDLAKIESGKMTLDIEEIELKNVINNLVGMFAPIANEKGIDLKNVLAIDLNKILITDRKFLEQILRNLLSNAIKFTEKGKVELIIRKPDNTEVEVLQINPVDFIAFQVSDTGIGIAEDKQDLIFEAFMQADGSTRRKYGGTGLGLSISKEIARLLGGDILLSSEPGKGSSFTLIIPVVNSSNSELANGLNVNVKQEDAKVNKEMSSKMQNAERKEEFERSILVKRQSRNLEVDTELAGKHILLVDDDARNIFSFSGLLEGLKMKVSTALNGKEAIEILNSEPGIDLVLLDLMMPEMDGYRTLSEIRNELGLDIPVIVITAKAMQGEREKCLALGASDLITKPVDGDRLTEILKMWLGKK